MSAATALEDIPCDIGGDPATNQDFTIHLKTVNGANIVIDCRGCPDEGERRFLYAPGHGEFHLYVGREDLTSSVLRPIISYLLYTLYTLYV